MFSFDTPESPGGVFINLCTFQVRRCSRRDSGGARDWSGSCQRGALTFSTSSRRSASPLWR
jgi:Variant UBP zinc finger